MVTRAEASVLRVAVTGTAMIAVAYGFARYGFGLFVPVLREEFGLSLAAVGATTSAAYASYLIGLLGAGALANRHGPRRAVMLGAVTAATGTTLVAVADRAWLLIVGVVLAASSSGLSWAPFSDATTQLLPAALRDRALAVISTGTSFGLILAGTAALLATDSSEGWRWAWAAFAAAALLTGAANARLLPTRPMAATRENKSKGREAWRFLRPGSGRLLALAATYGGLAAVYFTYAVDLVRSNGLSPSWAVLLWTLIGAGGISGIATGDLVARIGLRRSITSCLLLLAAATAALAAAPSNVPAVAAATLVFGAAYMPVSALLALWSQRTYPDRPTSGFTVVLVALAAGSITAPLVFGALADHVGLRAIFLLLALLTLPTALLRPHRQPIRHNGSSHTHQSQR
jgi:predicted MFS family arabinose efflux permease